MVVSLLSFFYKNSDPAVGGMYVTLLKAATEIGALHQHADKTRKNNCKKISQKQFWCVLRGSRRIQPNSWYFSTMTEIRTIRLYTP